MKTLLLIDANSLIHRSFHALPPLTNREGAPVQSIYGMSSILLRLWREARPDYAAALFDRPEPTFRKKEYKEYKAQRPPAPSELISQIIEAHNLFPAFGIKVFEKAGFEADDLIATFAEKFKNESVPFDPAQDKPPAGLQVVILTGDRDTLQLVEGEKVVVRTFKTGISDTFVYNHDAVVAKYGLEPEQLIDYKALVGDASDNIKGVPGIGPKTAADLLKRFNTLESVFENAAGDAKLEHRLVPFRKEAELSKMLVTLKRDVPVPIEQLAELEIKDGTEIVKSYFGKMGFDTLIRRLEGANEPVRKEAKPKKRPQKPMF
jgi:DNA polymerase I